MFFINNNKINISKKNYFMKLNQDVSKLIISFLDIGENRYFLKKDIISIINNTRLIYLIFRVNIYKDLCNKYTCLLLFMNKYFYSQDSYEQCVSSDIHYKIISKKNRTIVSYIPPLLTEALYSGLRIPNAYSKHKFMTPDIENDIKKITILFPILLESDWSYLRCRTNVTPFHASCINPDVSIDLIKFLIKNGADKNKPILVNGVKVSILDDILDDNYSTESLRIRKLKKLFE